MNVLFVCEGNVNRSQMAAGILKSVAPDVSIRSAGTMVPAECENQLLSEASTRGIDAMHEIGIDMSSQRRHQLTPAMLEWADRVILMGPTPGGPLPEFLEASPKLTMWNVPDPGYQQISHVDARDMIKGLVEDFAKSLSTHI